MGPARLRVLLAHGPQRVWGSVVSGSLSSDRGLAEQLGPKLPSLAARWRTAARSVDVSRLWQAHGAAGIRIVLADEAAMPRCLAEDFDGPPLLCTMGELLLLEDPTVALVGTRACTRYGHDVARSLGRDLTRAGVRVVSGLAKGIDAAAHLGVLDEDTRPEAAGGEVRPRTAGPIGVVGTGLDVPYPRSNRALWRSVGQAGLLMSEYPLGTPPATWRFPARNRLIAAAADVVVVVESHGTGGALLTAEEAAARGRTVLAVPGPVHSGASEGCNRLLGESAAPCLGAADVLEALGWSTCARPAERGRPRDPAVDEGLLEVFGWEPVTIDHLVLRSGRSLAEVSRSLVEMEASGRVVSRDGWYERVAPT